MLVGWLGEALGSSYAQAWVGGRRRGGPRPGDRQQLLRPSPTIYDLTLVLSGKEN